MVSRETEQDQCGGHTGGHPETPLEMERRHVREGNERIARQETMVARLDRRRDPEAAVLARELLDTMRSLLISRPISYPLWDGSVHLNQPME
jgi:hypothetical protein